MRGILKQLPTLLCYKGFLNQNQPIINAVFNPYCKVESITHKGNFIHV